VKADAHPGIPFAALGTKNSMLLEDHHDLVVEMCCEMLVWQIVFAKEFGSMTSKELVEFGLWDPVRMFVKDEPHSEAKLDEGRVRLIANVSLRVQLIERLVCGKQNNAEIAAWWKIPACPGLGLDDASLELLGDRIDQILGVGEIAMTDVSGWDWSVKAWLLWADAERRRVAAGEDEDSLFAEMVFMQAYGTANSVYGLSDGELVTQLSPGIQNSGSYKTSSTNSWMRIILFMVAYMLANPDASDEDVELLLERVMAMGDDCLELHLRGVQEMYGRLGFKTSLSATASSKSGVEFCSHIWPESGNQAYPTSWPRTLVRFFSSKRGPDIHDRLAQLEFVLRHHPRCTQLLEIAHAWVEQANKTHD